MRAIPQRLRKLVDAPVVVFGHTHDPRWQPLRGGRPLRQQRHLAAGDHARASAAASPT